jgi:hypothetical protein
MQLLRRLLYPLALLIPLIAFAEPSRLEGRWRLDPTRSTPLDGWTAWDLVITTDGSSVNLKYDMQLIKGFFRVAQRHMAVYPAKTAETPVRAAWLDGGRTLRVEAEMPLEISQGETSMRIYSEYRLLEGDGALLLIELHAARPRPLVYRFTKVTTEK